MQYVCCVCSPRRRRQTRYRERETVCVCRFHVRCLHNACMRAQTLFVVNMHLRIQTQMVVVISNSVDSIYKIYKYTKFLCNSRCECFRYTPPTKSQQSPKNGVNYDRGQFTLYAHCLCVRSCMFSFECAHSECAFVCTVYGGVS